MKSKFSALWLGVFAAGAISPLRAQTPSLITPAALQALADTSPVRVLDVRQSWVSYLQNHLPNAAWLNIETLRAQDGELPFRLVTGARN